MTATPPIPIPFAHAEPLSVAGPPLHILVTINGPGEVAAWLFPFIHELRQRRPDAEVTVALLPCVFASGREADVLGGMAGVDRVVSPEESMPWIMRGRAPLHVPSPDLVMHLGGELLLSVRLARRLNKPLLVYEEGHPRWSSLVSMTCLRDDHPAAHREPRRMRVVGNLMVDAARLRVPTRVVPLHGSETIALFPGSRSYFVKQLIPLLLRVASLAQPVRPGVRWVLAKSDFIDLATLGDCLKSRDDRLVGGDDGALRSDGRRTWIQSTGGVRVDVLSPADAMRRASVAVTIPGTNTAELAALGVPMLLILPAYRLHALPLPGLAGHLGSVPIIGPLIKEGVARSYLALRRYWAHPNRLAGRMVVPELIGRITARDVADRLHALLASPLLETSATLQHVMGRPGAAARLVDEALTLAGARR